MSRTTAAWGLLLLLLGWVAGPLCADDEEALPPKDLAPRAADFSPPKPDRALDVSLRAWALDVAVGTVRLEAQLAPAREAEQAPARWDIRESLRIGDGEDAAETSLEALLEPTLEAVQGRATEGTGREALTFAWHRAGDGYDVEVTGDERAPVRKHARREGHALVGLTSVVLLARELRGTEGTYRTLLFEPTWEYLEAERPYVEAHVEVGPGRWSGREVFRLHLTSSRDDRQTIVVLDPEGGDVLYVHLLLPHGPAFDLRPDEEEDPEPDVPSLDEPARTPLAAALRTTLAFLTADAALFEEVVHWGKLQEYGKSYVRGNVTPEAFRKAILEQFARNVPPPMEPQAARARVLAARGEFRVQTQGEDRAVVTLPPSISPMRLTLERIEGFWYLVRLPHE